MLPESAIELLKYKESANSQSTQIKAPDDWPKRAPSNEEVTNEKLNDLPQFDCKHTANNIKTQ